MSSHLPLPKWTFLSFWKEISFWDAETVISFKWDYVLRTVCTWLLKFPWQPVDWQVCPNVSSKDIFLLVILQYYVILPSYYCLGKSIDKCRCHEKIVKVRSWRGLYRSYPPIMHGRRSMSLHRIKRERESENWGQLTFSLTFNRQLSYSCSHQIWSGWHFYESKR